jgi:hypothetical protein
MEREQGREDESKNVKGQVQRERERGTWEITDSVRSLVFFFGGGG